MIVPVRLIPALATWLGAWHTMGPAQLVAPNPVGVWRGTSSCLVRPSPCRDEIVVYRIARRTPADSVSVEARKVVNGQEEQMGVLDCRLVPPSGQLVCTIPRAVWRFTIHGDSLFGELRLADSTKYREVHAVRSR